MSQDGLESQALLVSLGQRGCKASQVEEDQMALLVSLELLEDLVPKVYLDLLVWMDSMDFLDLKGSLEPQVDLQEVPLVPLVFQV